MDTSSQTSSKEDKNIDFYDQHGNEYVACQREFYTDTEDTGRKFFREALLENIKNMTIADIGCGAGDDLMSFVKMGAKKVIGIEPSETMLNEAKKTVKKNGLDVELVLGSWTNIPLPNESVDAVTARYSFHVLWDFEPAFKEVARVLKPGGLFLIAAPHPLHDARMVKEQQLKPGETIKIPIFEGKFIVENPPHSMNDYLSETCLKYFELEDEFSYSMHEDSKEAEPSGLLLRLRRK